MVKKLRNKQRIPIYVIIGTRAQLIKMAPVMRAMEKEKIEYDFLYTQQHKVTIEDLIKNFQLKTPIRNILEVKKEAKTKKLFANWFFKMLIVLFNPFSRKKVFKKGRGLVITHGDTATSAWAAIYAQTSLCKVLHIESGMRSFNLLKPFPEELMRIITFYFTNYYACPYQEAIDNIKSFNGIKINTNANTMFDSFTYAHDLMSNNKLEVIKKKFNLPKRFALFSTHRYENIFNVSKLKIMTDIIENSAKRIPLVIILHPATEKQFKKFGYYEKFSKNENIKLIPRQDFLDFVGITKLAKIIMTDGGSNQQEMSYLGKPTVLLRDVTESKEGIGENVIMSYYKQTIVDEVIDNFEKYQVAPKKFSPSPTDIIIDFLKKISSEEL